MSSTKVKLQIVQILETENDVERALTALCELLQLKVPHYDWVGFYFMNHSDRNLHLGPYSGAETDHTIIPFGKGICGQVAESGNTFVVDDVNAQDNYIACSIEVKSEIVEPLYFKNKLIGQLDIDSHKLKAFSAEDQLFLKDLCKMLAEQYREDLVNFAHMVSKSEGV